jgi:hypothetical protein
MLIQDSPSHRLAKDPETIVEVKNGVLGGLSIITGSWPETAIWEVTNLVHPKSWRKAETFTPLLVSVADDAA